MNNDAPLVHVQREASLKPLLSLPLPLDECCPHICRHVDGLRHRDLGLHLPQPDERMVNFRDELPRLRTDGRLALLDRVVADCGR